MFKKNKIAKCPFKSYIFFWYVSIHLILFPPFSHQPRQIVTERAMKRACNGSPRSSRARASTMKPARACTTSSSRQNPRARQPAARVALATPSSTRGFRARNRTPCLQTARASLDQLPVELMLSHKPPLKPCGDPGRPLSPKSRALNNDLPFMLYIYF